MTKQKKAYLTYLKSGHWETLRKQAFERDNYRCVKCGSDQYIHGHHKRYRKDLRKCTVKDVETLCDKCHKSHHREHREKRRENRKLRNENYLTWLIGTFSAK